MADTAEHMQAMVWLGQCLVLATALRYVLFNPRTKACTELFSVSPEAPPPTMVQAAPAADEAILLMVRHHSAQACMCVLCVSCHFLHSTGTSAYHKLSIAASCGWHYQQESLLCWERHS